MGLPIEFAALVSSSLHYCDTSSHNCDGNLGEKVLFRLRLCKREKTNGDYDRGGIPVNKINRLSNPPYLKNKGEIDEMFAMSGFLGHLTVFL